MWEIRVSISSIFLSIALFIALQIGAIRIPQPPLINQDAASGDVSIVNIPIDSSYWYVGPPTISREVYTSVFCQQNGEDSEICRQAPGMYDTVVEGGVDPAVELSHASNESSFGKGGVGMPPWFNLHGIHCHVSSGIGRCFRNTAPGDEDMQEYDNYPDAVSDWVYLITQSEIYYPQRNTPEQVVEIYCECGGDAGKADYVRRMKEQIDGWRAMTSTQLAEKQYPSSTGGYESSAITTNDGDCGYNVVVALDANSSALRNVVIPPGGTFSFNATMGNPSSIDYRTCEGVPGGNWCNLAARYSQVARALGLSPEFQDHNADLGAGRENSVTIWNEDGQAGGQDLLITNTLPHTVSFRAEQRDESIVIIGEKIS